MIVAVEWTPILAAAVAALAVLAGTIPGIYAQSASDRRAAALARADRRYEERRDTYLALFVALDQLRATTDGHVATGTRATDSDQRRVVVEAGMRAQLLAPAHVWDKIEPWQEAIAIRSSITMLVGRSDLRQQLDEATEALQAIGADTPDGLAALERQARDAVRRDIAECR